MYDRTDVPYRDMNLSTTTGGATQQIHLVTLEKNVSTQDEPRSQTLEKNLGTL